MGENQASETGTTNVQLSILFISVFLSLMGFGLILPFLPNLNTFLGGTPLDYGLIIALYSLMQFIFAPVWGSISDKVGRKPVIIIGLAGSGVGFAMVAYATELYLLYLARGIAGIFTAATLTTANAYIADVTPPKDRAGAFSLISAAFGLGFALGPGIGGVLANMNALNSVIIVFVPELGSHVLPSLAGGLMGIISMIAAIIFLPESLDIKLAKKVEGRSKFPIVDTFKYRKNKNSLLYITIFAFVGFGLSSFITAFPLFAIAFDDSVGDAQLALYFTYVGIILFVIQTFFIRGLIKRLGEAVLVKLGLGAVIFGFVVVSLVPNFAWTFLPNGIFTIGIAFLLPTMNSLISNSAAPEDQGHILGISQGWSAFARILGPIFAGYIFEFGIRIPFLVSATIYLILLLVAIALVTDNPGKSQ